VLSRPPKPIVPPAALPPGSAIAPKEVSTTGSSSVPEKRAIVARTIWWDSEDGRSEETRARYFAEE